MNLLVLFALAYVVVLMVFSPLSARQNADYSGGQSIIVLKFQKSSDFHSLRVS